MRLPSGKKEDLGNQQPPTEVMKATEVRQHFASVINRVAKKEARIIIEKSGVPVAAIVSAADIERLERFDADLEERQRVLEAMRAPFRDVPPEEIERETDRIIAEIRAENRRARQAAAARVS